MQHRTLIVLGIYKPLVVGDAGYFIIAVNVSATGTSGHTVKENGSNRPRHLGLPPCLILQIAKQIMQAQELFLLLQSLQMKMKKILLPKNHQLV